MRGQEHVIAVRMAGRKPQGVYLWDMPVTINGPQWVEDYAFMDVCTAGDPVGSLDLRFVVGIPVTVFGDDSNRVREIARQCCTSGADRVIASAGEKFAMWTKQGGKWLST
jgi:hypothetical protein